MRIASTTGLTGRLQSRGVASERFQSRPYGSQSEKAQRKPDDRTRDKPPLKVGPQSRRRQRSPSVRPAACHRQKAVHIHPRFGRRSRMRVFGRPGLFCDEAGIAGVEMIRKPFLQRLSGRDVASGRTR